jgi:glucokinase
MTRILAADIGGTHSRFAWFELGAGGRPVMAERRWLNTREAGSFAHLLDRLRADGHWRSPGRSDIAVVAVAGPVEAERFSDPPNIDWQIDLSQADIGLPPDRCILVNDFIAQAWACGSPLADSARPVLPGKPAPGAVRAVIGAGTGLGHAALVPIGAGRFAAVASEGGHAGFAFAGPREVKYARFLERETGEPYVRGETVVSGSGLNLLHRFLSGEDLRPAEIAARLDPGSETLTWMARFYARAARDYALQVLARGGLYIAGGVAAKLPALVTHPAFAAEFRLSATMARVLAQIPVFLITDEESGLWGAAQLGAQRLGGITN